MLKIGTKLHQELKWVGPFDGGVTRAAIGDFNGDKVPDLVINIMDKIASTSDVYIFTATATGHISESSELLNPRVASYQNDAIVVADINKDGRSDLVVAQNGGDRDTLQTEFPDRQLIYLSNKSGGYTANLSETLAWAHNAVIADINSDSYPDAFFFANSSGSSLLAYGPKNLSESISFTTAGLPEKALKSRVVDTWDIIDKYNDGWVKNARIWHQHNANFNDVDRDGDQDMLLFFTASKEGLIYLNDGKNTPDFSSQAPLKFNAVIPGWTMSGNFMFFSRSEGSNQYTLQQNIVGMSYYETVQFDINQDGWKDIVAVGTYHNEKNVTENGKTTYLDNTNRFNNGTIYQTLINNGAGLSDETATRIVQPKLITPRAEHYGHFQNLFSVDLNGDGHLDFVSNQPGYGYGKPNRLGESDTIFMINDAKGNFSPVVLEGLEYGSFAPMPVGGKLGFVHVGLASRWTQSYNDIKVFQTDVPWTSGDSASNFLYGTVGNDIVDGGSGIDTFYLNGRFDDFSYFLRDDATASITERSGLSGIDTLIRIERLRFDDRKAALDLDGNAGKVAKVLGATFGKSALTNKEYVGAGLSLLDQGMSYQDLAALAVSVTKRSSATDICNLLWTNVFGKAPSAVDIAPFKAMLDSGQMSIGALTALAADTSFNSTNIDLVGLSRTGLEYV